MSRILLVGLDCAAPELLLGDERLVHIRHLMQIGCFGRLESVVPPITVPAWMCMATSQDPGSLGVYGFRNRADRGYGPLTTVTSRSFRAVTIWDQVAMQGGRSVLIGVPPSFPPRRINGLSVGCFLTPDTRQTYTHPPALGERIAALVGDYAVDVKGFRTDDKDWLLAQIHAMTEQRFAVVRELIATEDWDYFQLVEIGLDRLQHGFWQYCDPEHRLYEPGNPYESVIADYYALLDVELGRVLERVPEDTIVCVASDHGAQRIDGGLCINEWLIEQGLLVLEDYPDEVTAFDGLRVDWAKTTAWAAGGYYARIFLNIAGREPQGLIPQADALATRARLAEALQTLTDDRGAPLRSDVYFAEEIYRDVQGLPPDLIVHLGGLSWRAIGSVGHRRLHIEGNDRGPDGCNHAQHGAFVLAGPGVPAAGEFERAHLLDVAPTLLQLADYDVPPSMQGRSLLDSDQAPTGLTATDEETIRERLSGLGYIG